MKNIKTTTNLGITLVLLVLIVGCAAKKELAYSGEVQPTEKVPCEQLEKRVDALNSELQTVKNWNADLRNLNDELTQRLRAARISLSHISGQTIECPETMKEGIVFKVQIGAFKDWELSDDLTSPTLLGTEKKDELQKIVVGQFRDYQKAELLKAYIKGMGIEDAWVVSYKDNQRISIEAALSELNNRP